MIREKVLIVDDHKEYADTLKIGLEKAGFEVVIKCDFATGLEAMKNGRFDIALIDVRLEVDDSPHDTSGIELAQGYRLKLLITICESMSSKSKKVEMKEHVVKHVAQNWFANANRPVPLEDPS